MVWPGSRGHLGGPAEAGADGRDADGGATPHDAIPDHAAENLEPVISTVLFDLIWWWRPDQVWESCSLGWQLWHAPAKTELSNYTAAADYCYYIILLIIKLNITKWNHPAMRHAATWLYFDAIGQNLPTDIKTRPLWIKKLQNLIFDCVSTT